MSATADDRQQRHLAAVSLGDGQLLLQWDCGTAEELHFVWLRDNCTCRCCLHPDTEERLVSPLSWPLDIAPESAEVDAEGLSLRWPGGHESRFSSAWLWDHRYSESARDERRKSPMRAWDASLELPRLLYGEVMAADSSLRDFLQALETFGLALLLECPRDDREVLRIARRISYARPTNFGLHFDVRSKPRPNNNAYTAIELGAHTDLPNWAEPPGFQLLHCLENAAQGGDSIFVDGARVVEVLRAESQEDFELLCTTPIPFRFHDERSDIRHRAPIIGLDDDGVLVMFRYNQGVRDVPDVPTGRMEAFYRAQRRLAALLCRDELVARTRLEPGQLVIFDNHRVLHGRTSFDPRSGPRHFQGCYVDHDELISRLRILRGG